MKPDELKQLEAKHIMQTYKRFEVVLESGDGCYVYGHDGKKYLDFVGGIATCTVGHANQAVAKAVADQASKLASVSNLYYTELPVRLAKKLAELSGLKKCFFCHSGADSNEAAIKLAKRVTGKSEFISFENAFHGRTTGSLALTWAPKYREPFMPLSPPVKFAKFGDTGSVKQLINDQTAAVIVEPIQGEAGVVVPKPGFLKELRELCDQAEILLIIDEVQTGVGRTGKFFAYQHEGILPDIVTVAKGLANGLPIGVCLSNYDFGPGEHGSTLGGNNLSIAGALATIDYIEKHRLQDNAREVGEYLMSKLEKLDGVSQVRGKGLMIGAVLKEDKAKDVVAKALDEGLLCNAPAPNIIRLLPPLIATKEQADECIQKLERSMQ